MSKIVTVNVNKLNQISNKDLYVGMLGIEDVVSVVKYTVREPIEYDPFGDELKDKEKENQYYQRIKDSDRAYNIKMFFLRQLYNKYTYEKNLVSPLAIFPSSIILGCTQSLDEDMSNDKYKAIVDENSDINYVFVDEELEKIHLNRSQQILIVDGQHRIAGLENLLNEVKSRDIKIKRSQQNEFFVEHLPPFEFIEEHIKEFKFIVTFLIDFDRYEQAELFAIVNFNQKPVNKSYMYDIFGSSQKGKTIEKLLHDLTSYLNYNASSPFYKKIKMLGRGPGYFSQAFLVDAFIPLFKKGIFENVYRDYENNGSKYKKLPKYLSAYFSAFSDAFDEYLPIPGEKYKHILYKTNGLGAIIALMPYINKKIKHINNGKNVLEIDEQSIYEGIKKIIEPISSQGEKYFGENGDYSKGSSKGLQNKLFNQLLDDLNIEKDKNVFL